VAGEGTGPVRAGIESVFHCCDQFFQRLVCPGPRRERSAFAPVRERTAPLCQEAACLPDGPCDGRAVDTEQRPQCRVRKVVPQMDASGHHRVDEDQLCRAPAPAARLLESPRAT
jgi:hypothetical protein